MPVLQFLENVGKNIVHPFAQEGNALLHVPEAIGREIQNKPINDIQQKVYGTTNSGSIAGQIVGNTAQIGLTALAPGAGRVASSAVGADALTGVGGSVARGAIGGASVGGAFNVAGGVSQGQTSPSELTMNFLSGTAAGAALGGAAGAAGSVAKTLFSSYKLRKMATSESPSQIEKDVKPTVGPVVAQKIAPAIASSKDPEIVSNIVDNAVKEHLPSPTTPEPPITTTPSVGNEVNAGQGSAPTTPVTTPDIGNSPELKAQQGMQEILNRGGTVDEALNHHMETTGGNIGEAQQALRTVTGAVDTQKGQINASLNPEFGKLEIPKADSNERAILNSRMVRNQITRTGNAAMAEVDKLSKEDMALLDQRSNPADLVDQAKDKAQFLRAANAVKKYNDTTHALGAGQLEQDVPYRQNYGAPLKFDRSTPEAEQAYQDATLQLKNSPGYGKGRFFKNYDDAAELSNGQLKRQNENFLGDLRQDIEQRQNDLSQLTLAKGLEETNPGQVRIGKPGATEDGVDAQLRIPGGSKIFMPKGIADEINKRAPAPGYSPTTGGRFLKGYDTLNSNFKNLKLAGGGFHSINVLGSYIGQQMASGRLFTPSGVKDLTGVVRTTFSEKANQATLRELETKGTLTNADAAGLKFGRGETAADVNPSGIGGNIPVLKQIHEAIFDRQIPMLKLKLFDQLTENLDRNNPEHLKQMTDIAQGLNKTFGGLNREINGLSAQSFQRFSRVFLATDYNEGQLRTLGNAFTRGGAEGKLARQVVFGKALLFGGLATAGGAAGGEFQGKDAKQIAFNILQKVANPQFDIGGYKVGLPTTQIAEVAKPIEQTISGAQAGKGLLQGAQNFASNRLAAIPSEAIQGLGNQNYIGQHLYGQDTHGRPISPGKTAANVASGVLPIPVAQAGQTATGNQSPLAAIANTAGLRVTAQNNTANLPVEQQTYISTLQKAMTDSNIPADKQKAATAAITNFDAIVKQNSAARTKVDAQINKDIASGNMAKAKADANAFNDKLYQAISKAITSDNSQYLNVPIQGLKTPYQYLTGNTYGYFTNLNLSGRRKTIDNNPTKYGLKIGDKV